MITVERYTKAKKELWNSFLLKGKNQTFLLNRNYMDYHQYRFTDHSLMILENDKVVALLPANLHEDTSIISHAGLTYGGFVVNRELRSIKSIEYFYHSLNYLFDQGITDFYFKQIPSFYNEIFSDEIDYALFLIEASLYRMDVASVINLKQKLEYQERRFRSIKKAEKLEIEVKEEGSFDRFWLEILTPNLKERFGIKPVHSLEEITLLENNNHPFIKQFNAYYEGKIVAGTTIYETPTTAHAQYISASDEGRKNGALDLLFHKLITFYYAHKDFFDFGIVNENNGMDINTGLLDWKEGFGGRACAHRFFKINTANFEKLEHILN